MAHKVEFYNDNIIMNMNVMELCREFKVDQDSLSDALGEKADFLSFHVYLP